MPDLKEPASAIDSGPSPQAGLIQPGQRLGNYRIVRPLGQGGMGSVYEAAHQYIDRKGAVKVLHPDLSQNPQFASRFLNEARAVNLIKHPGLVEIFEFGLLEDGTAYIIMELLRGLPLSEYMRRSPGGLGNAALPICRQIAQAMAAAHHKGIVHRELCPRRRRTRLGFAPAERRGKSAAAAVAPGAGSPRCRVCPRAERSHIGLRKKDRLPH